MEQLINTLLAMKAQLAALMSQLDIAGKRERIEQLEQATTQTEFWQNAELAQRTMQGLSTLRAEVERWQNAAKQVDDALELAQLGDTDLLDEMSAEVALLTPLEHGLRERQLCLRDCLVHREPWTACTSGCDIVLMRHETAPRPIKSSNRSFARSMSRRSIFCVFL